MNFTAKKGRMASMKKRILVLDKGIEKKDLNAECCSGSIGRK